MISKATLIGCALFGSAVYLVASHWDEIGAALGIEDPFALWPKQYRWAVVRRAELGRYERA